MYVFNFLRGAKANPTTSFQQGGSVDKSVGEEQIKIQLEF